MTAAVLTLAAAGLLMLLAAYYLGHRAAAPPEPETLRADVRDTLARDGWAASVKIYRERTGAGLLAAHDAVRRIAHDGR